MTLIWPFTGANPGQSPQKGSSIGIVKLTSKNTLGVGARVLEKAGPYRNCHTYKQNNLGGGGLNPPTPWSRHWFSLDVLHQHLTCMILMKRSYMRLQVQTHAIKKFYNVNLYARSEKGEDVPLNNDFCSGVRHAGKWYVSVLSANKANNNADYISWWNWIPFFRNDFVYWPAS